MAAPLLARKSLTKLQRVRVFDGNGGRCHLCSLAIKVGEAWQADHVQARWKGGTDAIGNYRPAHVHCHAVKSAAETTERAKSDAVRARHIGARIMPDKPIPGQPLPTTRRAANRQPKPALPPKRLYAPALT